MLIFTLGERQMIATAINLFGDDRQRSIWRSWASAHLNIRRGPADPWDDGGNPMPTEVAEVISSTLNQLFAARIDKAKGGTLSEDELADASNELTEIQSLAKSLG
jgi:hypothetical protein